LRTEFDVIRAGQCFKYQSIPHDLALTAANDPCRDTLGRKSNLLIADGSIDGDCYAPNLEEPGLIEEFDGRYCPSVGPSNKAEFPATLQSPAWNGSRTYWVSLWTGPPIDRTYLQNNSSIIDTRSGKYTLDSTELLAAA
jgi:hypothetical protein